MALYQIESCTQPGTFYTVNSGAVTLSVGNICSIILNEEIGVCGIVNDETPSGPVFLLDTLYESCEECVLNTPYGVNEPEYTLCVKDCDGNLVELILPHPVWTNNYGTAVIQLNAVELGGVNGLNN